MSERPARQAWVARAFLDDLRWWVETDRRMSLRVLDVMDAVLRDPFTGIGKPEPLRGLGADVWSRRVTQEHRLVYRVLDRRVDFLQARLHYERQVLPAWCAVEAFSKKYRVVRFDAQGFGQSPASVEPVPRAEDLYDLLHTLAISKAHLVGVSMGGAVAIDFTACHPEMVGSLVLVAAGLSGYAARDPALVGWLDQQEERQEKALARGDLDTATQIHLETWLAGPKRRLEDVMVGEYDVPVVSEIADELAARIPGSRKRVFLGAAHMLNMERSAEFNKAVLEFLEAYPLR